MLTTAYWGASQGMIPRLLIRSPRRVATKALTTICVQQQRWSASAHRHDFPSYVSIPHGRGGTDGKQRQKHGIGSPAESTAYLCLLRPAIMWMRHMNNQLNMYIDYGIAEHPHINIPSCQIAHH